MLPSNKSHGHRKNQFKKTVLSKNSRSEDANFEIKLEVPKEVFQNFSQSREPAEASSLSLESSNSSLLAPPGVLERSVASEGINIANIRSSDSFAESLPADEEFMFFEEERGGRKRAIKPYFLGEEITGSLCKISPKKLADMLKQTRKKIELLLLHTSYPYYHL